MSGPNDTAGTAQGIEALNKSCFCLSLDEAALRAALEAELGEPDLFALVQQRCPFLFSARPVFVSAAHLTHMRQVILAVENVVAMPAWQERVLARGPAVARHDPGGTKGVFLGYDFHINANSLGLIEINTNAGGAMLNAVLAKAQWACCPDIATLVPSPDARRLEHELMGMFINEWRLAGHQRPLRTIAIVDEAPQQQYLYPEFLLFQHLFQRQGLTAVIIGPEECELRNGALWHGATQIDLVYNRLTDFMLEHPATAVLREAYLNSAMVLTPNPRTHALYADKRNLVLLTDESELAAMGVSPQLREMLLAGIPRTQAVDPAQGDRLWQERRHLFFKPASGYGSRAAYRGDKLTKRVWQEILAGNYVAQALVQPGERIIDDGAAPQVLKFDLRNYVYDAAIQWVAARLYQGQTTNFRTPGGGFAPVYSTAADSNACMLQACSKSGATCATDD